MTVPQAYVPQVSAWLARQGYTILTAPRSLIERALVAVGQNSAA